MLGWNLSRLIHSGRLTQTLELAHLHGLLLKLRLLSFLGLQLLEQCVKVPDLVVREIVQVLALHIDKLSLLLSSRIH